MRPQRKCLGELTSCGKSMRMLLANRLSRCGHMGIRITVPLYNKLQCCPHDRIHLTVFMEFSPCNVLLHDFFLDFSQACHMCMRLSICKRLCRKSQNCTQTLPLTRTGWSHVFSTRLSTRNCLRHSCPALLQPLTKSAPLPWTASRQGRPCFSNWSMGLPANCDAHPRTL